MYLTAEYIMTAIKKLSAIHPFYGITYLSCKKNNLPIGTRIDFPMDRYTRLFMEEVHKINPSSTFYYQPYTSNAKEKCWVSQKYPSSGLQAINTQTFSSAFLHTKKEKTWGWSNNYIDVLVSHLKNSIPLPIIDLAIWVFKNKDWQKDSNLQTVSEFFIESFKITADERAKLFSEAIDGYTVSNPFQANPVTWNELSAHIVSPPDAAPSRGATLSYLELDNVGPTSKICVEPNNRLNIVTGDNGLGKSFLMECAWWALTGTWPDAPAQPLGTTKHTKASIAYELASETGIPVRKSVSFDPKQGIWPRDKKAPSIPGLIVYARVDGSYAVWDPVKQYSSAGAPRNYVFNRNEVWDGVPGSIEGLMRDWVKWQSTPDKYPFSILENVLRRMAPPNMGELQPGQPIRMINDIRDIPTIIHPYGEIPIINASAGVRRIITLAYLIVWAWHEHKVGAELAKAKPERRMVIIIDEIEAHLRNVSNLLRHLSREISVVHRSYVNICHLIAVHNDRLAMVLATLYMEPLGPCFHEANGDATAALVASLPR